MLIQSRDPLQIKLTDFGISGAREDLKTFCRTPLYLAPEVYKKKTVYTSAIDIWSLGVVGFELAYDLPSPDGYEDSEWCEFLVDQVNYWDNDGLIGLLSHTMIVMDPKSRRSARYYYEEASRLLVAPQERSLTPTPQSYAKYNTTDPYQHPFGPDHSASLFHSPDS